MAFRNIIVESSAFISLRREQLIIRTDSDHSVAIEDISALLLESRQTTITTADCPAWDSAAVPFLSATKSICPARSWRRISSTAEGCPLCGCRSP